MSRCQKRISELAFPWSTQEGTQVVELTEDAQFSVVADPFLGEKLFKSIGDKCGKYYGQCTNVASLNLSTWGWAVYAGAGAGVTGVTADQVILNTNGWNEVLANGARLRLSSSLRRARGSSSPATPLEQSDLAPGN